MNPAIENNYAFIRRFWIYQSERFPLLGHGVLIAAFTFSAISYSRICRGESGFINLADFGIGVFATLTFFLLVRIFDEFKDKEDDEKYRPYLPVPRGLISLSELKKIGVTVVLCQLLIIGFFQPQMIALYLIALVYLGLMRVEFFVPVWLKKHPLLYAASHMIIIPLIDLYSSGLDWRLSGSGLHLGLAWFFAVSFFNGFVLEFGRKIRTPDSEEEGVMSYTRLLGTKGGVLAWAGILTGTFLLALGASYYAGFGEIAFVLFCIYFIICIAPAVFFILKPSIQKSKYIEYASLSWALLLYFTLGIIPVIKNL